MIVYTIFLFFMAESKKTKFSRWNPNPAYQDPKRIKFWLWCRKHGVALSRIVAHEKKLGKSVSREGIGRALAKHQIENNRLARHYVLEKKLKRVRVNRAVESTIKKLPPGLSLVLKAWRKKVIGLYYLPDLSVAQVGKEVNKAPSQITRLIKQWGGVYKRDLFVPGKPDVLKYAKLCVRKPYLGAARPAHALGFTSTSMYEACKKYGLDVAQLRQKAKLARMKSWARFYLANPTATYTDVCQRFGIKMNAVFQAFRRLGVPAKHRKGRPGFGYKPSKAFKKDQLYLLKIWFWKGSTRLKIGRTFFGLKTRFQRQGRVIRRWKIIGIWPGFHGFIYPLEAYVKYRAILKGYIHLGPRNFQGRTECLKSQGRVRHVMHKLINRAYKRYAYGFKRRLWHKKLARPVASAPGKQP